MLGGLYSTNKGVKASRASWRRVYLGFDDSHSAAVGSGSDGVLGIDGSSQSKDPLHFRQVFITRWKCWHHWLAVSSGARWINAGYIV